SKYPFAADIPAWSTPSASDDLGPDTYTLDGVMMSGTLLPVESLNVKYPDAGRANMSLVFRKPGSWDRQIERLADEGKLWDQAEQAVAPQYKQLLDELATLLRRVKKPTREIWTGTAPWFAQQAAEGNTALPVADGHGGGDRRRRNCLALQRRRHHQGE